MRLEIDAIYQKGVLRPLEPLNLAENELVVVTVVTGSGNCDRSKLDVEYIEKIRKELAGAEPAPGRKAIRERLAKISGSMAAEIVAERGDR